jgi:hypothetical protein
MTVPVMGTITGTGSASSSTGNLLVMVLTLQLFRVKFCDFIFHRVSSSFFLSSQCQNGPEITQK